MSLESSDRIRKRISGQRNSLPKETVAKLSEEVIRRFLISSQIETLSPSRKLIVGLYKALSSELDLSLLEEFFKKLGWILCFPRISHDDVLEFVETSAAETADSDWNVGRYGVSEPGDGLMVIPAVSLDLIFVPGVAFGFQGERIGRGKGYYDRLLSRNSDALRVALAFDFQVEPALEQKPWDEPVHWVMTEKREFRKPQVDSWLNQFR